jgi:hypothetical protein
LEVKRSLAWSITEPPLVTLSTVRHRRSRVTQISLEATFKLPISALQRLQLMGAARRSDTECHEAAVGKGNRRRLERRLSEVLRSYGFRGKAGYASPNAST